MLPRAPGRVHPRHGSLYVAGPAQTVLGATLASAPPATTSGRF
ncbi:hypothetical protein [Streptomyces phaeoluteigriseus]|nr:hypothetical protein [Streptomyces phaeoluteigriseus]